MQREGPADSQYKLSGAATMARAPTTHPGMQGWANFYALGLGGVLGIALQLQQAELWNGWHYVRLGAAAGLLIVAMVWHGVRATEGMPHGKSLAALWLWIPLVAPLARWLVLALLAGCLGFAWAGSLALRQAARQLPAYLEGSTVVLTGVVQSMVQRNALGQRFRFRVNRPPPDLPPLLMVSWADGAGLRSTPPENGAMPQMPSPGHDVKPGDTWQLSVRLKAVHGNHNPGGFDYELWMWEQGLGANASVLSGTQGSAMPLRLHRGWRHPVERVRQAIRDRIFKHLSPYWCVLLNSVRGL